MNGDRTPVGGALVATTLLGVVETPRMAGYPYRVDRDGRPFLPVADAGVVLGLRLGDSVFGFDADHPAPGATLGHPDPAARHALTAFACLGNEAVVRTGAAAGAVGRVLGKRGGEGRVITVFDQDVLARLLPDDQVAIRAVGQGAPAADGVTTLNIDPALLPALTAPLSVRARVPSQLIGNGVGRPAHQWDIDLQLDPETAPRLHAEHLRLGDLVCVDDVDVRHNVGRREGWVTVAVVVHGASPLPGHGPGAMPVLCAPADLLDVVVEPEDHVGVTAALLGLTDA
ncbi:DUF4438 domain-containing protein [Actinokineospora cianjurensis]|uniref:Uncharacterized protein DUF4438 n=1 Tax=Actinokineospora cianjurensis TaxID=585224 RepID=A0A421B287_9PSEU|nr:DUF4438 domain-containing protein [Actinokineospora cianjurensis]RLK58511.1 uncharacterized protein DUF4438 [Actinokineospora cianjurensis]